MTDTNRYQIELDGKIIPYELHFKKIKRINLRIVPGAVLYVSAPLGTSMGEIESYIRDNRETILRFHRMFASYECSERQQYPVQFETGESVLLLGMYYTLEVKERDRPGVSPDVKSKTLRLFVPFGAPVQVRKKIWEAWWQNTCRQVVENLCRAVYPVFEAQNVAYPKEIRLRSMVSQWGNCRPKQGILTFNTRLLAAPVRCIEYVIVHEFTHFLHPDHSKAFYASVAAEIPDYAQVKTTLEKTVLIRLPGGN